MTSGGFDMFQTLKFYALLSVLLLSASAVFSQGTTGEISGVVTDPNNAVVQGANVTATNLDTNLSRTATTGDDGIYAFQLLPPGRYRVSATASGFQETSVEAVVNITQTTAVNITLTVAGATVDPIDVIAETPVLQTETSQSGRVVTGETIRQLPLPTRNFQQLLTLSPGAQSSVSNNTELGRGDATISVNGQRTTSNSVRINGIDANSIGTNSTPNIAVPATDSLQEFVVQTSLYDASNGRNAGGNVEAITRSGTNNFRGNVYYFLRDKSFNANDPFLKAAGIDRPILDRQQYGATLGGPIVRDRFFFFGSYQGTREKNGASLTNSVTVPVLPTGLTDANRTAAGLAATFGVPVATISPQALAILNARLPGGGFAIPSSSFATRTPSLLGFTEPQSGVSRFRENQFNGNLDFNFTQNHNLSAKFFLADNPTFQANYNFAGLGNGPTQLIGFGGDLTIKQKLYSITDNYVISPNLVNQARVGFSRLRVTSVPEETFSAADFGISSTLAGVYPGAPTLSFSGSDALFFFGSSTLADQSSRINAYTFNDTLSWTAGNHRLKFGGEYRFSQVKFYFNAFSRGQIIYNDTFNTTGVRTATAFQNFLQGIGTSLLGSGVYDRYFKVTDTTFFVQDDWKINSRLTLNLGLRYDLYGLPVEDQGRLVNFLPDQLRLGTVAAPAAPPNGIVQADGGNLAGVPTVEKTLVPVDKNNFAPRIGFAYLFNEDANIVVRGGYGIYYDRISTRYANTQLFNYPYFALGVGLVNNGLAPVLPAVFRTSANPFVPIPQPSQFPTAANVPSPLSPLSPAGFPIAGVFVDPDLETPYIQQYNLGVQGEFADNFVWEFGYVGNRGTHLLQVITLNQPVYNPATNTFAPRIAPAAILSANKNVTGGIQQIQTTSVSRYDSLQMSLSKRFSDGLQFLAAYTVGRSTDYYSGSAVNELTNIPGDQFNWKTNRGPSDFNRKHRFVVSGVYDLPNFAGGDSAAKWLLNDWQVAGIAVFQSGLPFSIVDSNGTSIIQRANFNPAFAGTQIDGTGDPADRLNQYFNTDAFRTSRLLAGVPLNLQTFDPNNSFGNTPRNFLFGPGQKNVDISLIKLVPFSERFRGEVRAEFFNVFNWVNYANPGSLLGTPTFGRITSASTGPRVVQFAFKLNF